MISNRFPNRVAASIGIAACIFATACDTPTIAAPNTPDCEVAPLAGEAYCPTKIVPFIYHWSAGHDIAIFVDPTAEPPDADLRTAVRDAIAVWEAVGPLGEVRMHIVNDVHDADVIVHHVAAPRLIISDLCDPTDIGSGGYTFICVSEDLKAETFNFLDGSDGHVKMDVAVSRGSAETLEIFRSIVKHELGHVLGIGAHSPISTDLMFGSPRATAPTAGDALTLRFVLSQRAVVRY